jgi:pimeloyl-ACP methyl ester carboxylesterase
MTVERVVFRGFEGVNLVADVRGPSDALTVLFLHGGGQTRHAWGRTAEVVAAQGWRTVSLDLRGHGESGWASSGNYSIAAFCEDCIAVIDQIGRPPVLVGASLGGMTAMLAEGRSDRTLSSGLVIVDVAPKTNLSGVKRIGVFMQSGIDGFASLEDAAAAIAKYTPQRVARVNPTGLSKVLRRSGDRWYWHWDPKILSGESTEMMASKFEALLDSAISNIHVPTMLVRGQLSDVVTQVSIDDMLARMPSVEVLEVPGAAHMIAGDQNDAFSDAVIVFLRERIQPTFALD